MTTKHWELEPGTFDVRCGCEYAAGGDEECAVATMRRFGEMATCSACGESRELCLATFGSKECVREDMHEGAHVSPSGSSWPAGKRIASCHPACRWINGSAVAEVPLGCNQCHYGPEYDGKREVPQ